MAGWQRTARDRSWPCRRSLGGRSGPAATIWWRWRTCEAVRWAICGRSTPPTLAGGCRPGIPETSASGCSLGWAMTSAISSVIRSCGSPAAPRQVCTTCCSRPATRRCTPPAGCRGTRAAGAPELPGRFPGRGRVGRTIPASGARCGELVPELRPATRWPAGDRHGRVPGRRRHLLPGAARGHHHRDLMYRGLPAAQRWAVHPAADQGHTGHNGLTRHRAASAALTIASFRPACTCLAFTILRMLPRMIRSEARS
jgi:hypothetical protein